MKQTPRLFTSMDTALQHVMSRLTIPLEKWIEAGPLLKRTLTQRKLTEYT
jgi:hypothetical protein